VLSVASWTIAGSKPSGPNVTSEKASVTGAVTSQIEAGARVHAIGRHRVDIALAEDDELLALDLHLQTVLRIEENFVAHLDASDMGPDGDGLGPGEASRDLGGGGDQDPRSRTALTLWVRLLDEDAIGEHGHGLLADLFA
jgi:hypothetical protein